MLAFASLLLILFCLAGAGGCRARWADLPRRTQSILIVFSLGLVCLYAFMLYSGWGCTSALVNEAVGAMAVGGYSLLVLLLTLFQPKILTRSLAALLLLPVPIATVLLPLSARSGDPIKTHFVAGELFVDKVRWDAGAMGSSGTTLLLYQRPRFAPFLKHHLQRVIFDDSKCRAEEAFVVLQPDKQHVLARCPWPEYSQKVGFHDFLVPLY